MVSKERGKEMKFEHVLVATDGSEGACKAAAVGGQLAGALGARISVLFVQSEELVLSNAWGTGAIPGGAMSVEQVRNMLEQQAQDVELPRTVDALNSPTVDVKPVLVWGHSADEICRYARENDVDMIVIGSHGRSGIREALLGSVSHAVANQAPCPVTIVR